MSDMSRTQGGRPVIRKAERKKSKLRLALIGPTGSGKTYSSLLLAFGLGEKIGLVDTEKGSGDLYANMGDYDIITLEPPYTVHKYREAIRAFEFAGYDVIIVDSLSHAWSGEGGLLEKSAQLEKSGAVKNSFAAWREITPEHNKLVEQLLTSRSHIIATMRVKTEYVLELNEKGKQVPRKVGLAPVQRDGVEYEFTIVMDISDNHYARASKDRTSLFDGWSDRISQETGHKLKEWLESGAEPAEPTFHDESANEKPKESPSLEDSVDDAIRKFDSVKSMANLERGEQAIRPLLNDLDARGQPVHVAMRSQLISAMNAARQRITKPDDALSDALPPVAEAAA